MVGICCQRDIHIRPTHVSFLHIYFFVACGKRRGNEGHSGHAKRSGSYAHNYSL